MKKISLYFIFLILTIKIFSVQPSFRKYKFYPKNIEWELTETDNFNIYYSNKDRSIIPILVQFAEDAYDFNRELIGANFNDKINIIFYSSPQYFTQNNILSSFIPPNFGGFATFRYDRVVIPFNGDINYFQELIYHEISHIFQYHKFFKSPLSGLLAKKIKIPTWVFEGLSEEATSNFDNPKFMILKDAYLNGYLHGPEYLQNNQNYDYLAYQQSHSIIRFLKTKYKENDSDKFIEDLRLTINVDTSLKKIYGYDFKTLFEQWKVFLREQIAELDKKFSSIYSNNSTKLISKNHIFLLEHEKFYITYENGSLIRKIRDKSYKEIIFKSSPFKYLIYSDNYIDISSDEFLLSYLFYKNNTYYLGIYNFTNQKNYKLKLPDLTTIEKIKFIDSNIYILGKKGINSIIYKIDKNLKTKKIDESKNNIRDFTIVKNNIIKVSFYGENTYINYQNKIKKIDGKIIKSKKYTDNSVLLLVTKKKKNVLLHYNLKNNTIYKFKNFKEEITNFYFTLDSLILNIFNTGKNSTVKTDIPEYLNEIKKVDIYNVPHILDDISYKIDDIQHKSPDFIPRFESILGGLQIEENRYLKGAIGSYFSNILNETQLYWQISTFLNNSSSFDFNIGFRKTGNRPTYDILFKKNTTFRNDREYYISKFRGTLNYPLSISDGISLHFGKKLLGFDANNLSVHNFIGTAFNHDTG